MSIVVEETKTHKSNINKPSTKSFLTKMLFRNIAALALFAASANAATSTDYDYVDFAAW